MASEGAGHGATFEVLLPAGGPGAVDGSGDSMDLEHEEPLDEATRASRQSAILPTAMRSGSRMPSSTSFEEAMRSVETSPRDALASDCGFTESDVRPVSRPESTPATLRSLERRSDRRPEGK